MSTQSTFTPYIFHNNLTGNNSAYKMFVEDIYNISGGIALILQIANQSLTDKDDGEIPYLNAGQIDALMKIVISMAITIENRAESLIEWGNRMDEIKGGASND